MLCGDEALEMSSSDCDAGWLREDRGSREASTPPETTRGARELPWQGPAAPSMSAVLLKARLFLN